MNETSAVPATCRAALVTLLKACETFDDMCGWGDNRAYADSWVENEFKEAVDRAAGIADAPNAGETLDRIRDGLRALVRASRWFMGRFSDDVGKAYFGQEDKARWDAARLEGEALLRE
jgi:hypothetical protein